VNVRLDLEFDGTAYFGWQYQPNRPTIQGTLEKALSRLFGARIGVTGVGRTDAGVSALSFTANFHLPGGALPRMPLSAIPPALNQLLPDDIRVKRAVPAGDDFHARYDARSKLYRYTIAFGPTPVLRQHVWELGYPVDTNLMVEGAKLFLGEHDFAPFCRLRRRIGDQGFVNVMRAAVRQRRSPITGARLLQVEFQADRFLYKMVRRMVGTLVDVGRGKFSLDDLRRAITVRPLVQFQTAPAAGLVLVRVYY